MPAEAETGTLTRWVFENPWPLSIGLLVIAASIVGYAIRRDDHRPFRFALGFGIAGVAVLTTGLLVETTGERAEASTRKLVALAVDGDVDGMIALLGPGATLHLGRVENPGYPRDELERNLDALRSRQRIEDNTISRLDSAEGRDGAVWVDLGCFTRTGGSGGWVPSRWVIEWSAAPDEDLRIRSITLVNLAGRSPQSVRFLR